MPEKQTDGRNERRSRGKQHALETAAQMFAEGDIVRTMAHLAEKSGISERTLFRYFATQDKVIEEVTAYLIPHIAPYFSPEPIQGNLQERILALVELRLEYVKKYSSMIRTLETHAARFSEASEIRRGRDILLNDQFNAWLGDDAQSISMPTRSLAKSLIELRSLDTMYAELGDNTATAVSEAIITLIKADSSR